jgi:hypothetical protein
MPMQWLLGVELTSDVTLAIQDWVHNCYLPIQTGTMEGQDGRTIEELLPWGTSPMRRGLTTREVVPGAQTGITWMRGPSSNNTVRCDVYLDAVEVRTQAWLYELKSPRNTPLLEVFQEELGLDAHQQARFLLYREMLRAAGPAVPAPSLTGTYAALRGAGVAGAAVEQGSTTALRRWSLPSTLLGAGRGAVAGLGHEWQRTIDGLSWIVGLAVMLTWWGPYLIGLLHLVLIGLFPFAVLWALIPGTQFQPLAGYFVALLFTCSSPLWWAIIDQAQRLAGATARPTEAMLFGLGNTAVAAIWSAGVTTLGIMLVPMVCALLFFAAFRGVGHLWHGGF